MVGIAVVVAIGLIWSIAVTAATAVRPSDRERWLRGIAAKLGPPRGGVSLEQTDT